MHVLWWKRCKDCPPADCSGILSADSTSVRLPTPRSHSLIRCGVCGGKGKIVKSKCPHCKGKKVKRGSHEFTLDIEKGMRQGQKIVLEGEADESPDANAGNLVFVIQTLPHDVFTRVGENLYMKQVISLKESLLGFKKTVKQLDGEILNFERSSVTPPGLLLLIAGFVLAIKEEGFPRYEYASERGDLFIEFSVAFPETASPDLKKLLQ